MLTLPKSRAFELTIFYFSLAVLFAAAVFAVYSILPVSAEPDPPRTWGFSVDWKHNIREGSLRLISGLTPYERVNDCFPPWVYLMLAPVAVLPPALGAAVMFVLSYAVYAFSLRRLGAKPVVILAFLFCRFAFVNAQNGNLDFLPVLGAVLPPQIGLFFVLAKPQVGAGVALFWLVEALRRGRLREAVRVFAPVTVAYLISFAVFGPWLFRLSGMPDDPYNAALWPLGVLVAAALLYKSLRDRSILFALASGPFLSPYVNISSFAVALFPLIPHPYLFLIASVLTWR